jgi:hypothetical protein
VECLDLTIRPWSLPIDELRWGRLLTDTASAVWIDWRGREPRTLVAVDGTEVAGARVQDSSIEWRGGSVELRADRVLRTGRLERVLYRHPLLRAILPRSMRALEEHKTVGRGTLSSVGGTSGGWAIYEMVRFRNP